MDGNWNIKSKSRRNGLNRNEKPILLKPDMMLITKDVMIPIEVPSPHGKLSSAPEIFARKNSKINGIERLSSQSLKPLLKPEVYRKNYVEQSLIDIRTKNSSFPRSKISPTSDIAPQTKAKSPSYCLSRSNVLRKKYYSEKNRRVSLAREEPSPRPDPGFFRLGKIDDGSNFDPGLKARETDEPLTRSSENSLSSGTTYLETDSRSSSRVLEDSLPKLPELNIVSSSGSENNIPRFEQREKIIVSKDINEFAESNVVDNVESESVGQQLIPPKIDSVVERIDESNEINLDSRSEVCESKGECHELIESRNSITMSKSEDEPRRSDTEKVIVDEVMNNAWRSSDKKDQIFIRAAENDRDTDDRIMIDVECLLRFLITNVSVSEDFNRENSQSSFSNSYCPDRERSDDRSNERRPKMVELKNSSNDLPSFVSPMDFSGHSFGDQEPIIDLETKYSWQYVDPITPNVCDDFSINPTEIINKIEVKYSWQIIEEDQKDLNEVYNSESNSKETCTDDLCLNEPEYQYSWQNLTSKYLAGNDRDDSSVNKNESARNIDVNSPMNTDREFMKSCFRVEETFKHNSKLISSRRIEDNNRAVNDIGRIVAVNSPLNNIISSMLPDIKLINRSVGFDNSIKNYSSSNSISESNKSSTPYSSMSGIKHIIASLNDMVKTQRNMFDSYVRDDGSDKKRSHLVGSVPAAPDRVEKVEIFPSTLHVLGDYILRDIRPEDINSSKHFPNIKNNETESGQSVVNHLVNSKNNEANKVLNEKIAETNTAMKNDLLSDDLTESKDGSSPLPSRDIKNADFPSIMSYPIPFNSSYCSSTLQSNDRFIPEINNLQKSYEAEIIPSNEIEDGSLLPVLGYDSTSTDNYWEPGITEMEEPVSSSLESGIDDKGTDDKAGSLPYTKSIGLLKPRLQISFSQTKEVGNSNTREDELATRLESAMSRLKQCEEQIDANWNLDYSVLDPEENTSQEKKDVRLPEQVEEHIKDIIKSAEEYLAKLEEQLKDLRSADDQIINSSERTCKDIDETYQLLMDNLCQEINKRRNLVRLETEVFKYEGLAPLRACKQEVDAQIRSTQHLIVLTETMLTHPSTFNRDRLGKIITASSHMGRIPAVPMPEELPYVTFSPPNEDVKKEIADRISSLGCVLRMGPAQFTEVFERPACLQLKWQIVDPEFAAEEQTFVVQKALGEISDPTSPAFETVYVGPETSCFVRDLPVDNPITLRVGIQVSDTAWSVHRIAQTSVPGYSWDISNSDYLITNSGRIATKVTQNTSTLLSRGPQYSADHIIEFKFLEGGSGGNEEGIGLVYEPVDTTESLKRSGALLITPNGNIFIDGEEKLMQLPKMQLGTRIIFTSEQKDEDTLRMTIECANKAVTYDWTVQKPLHFAARFFEHNKWNFMVK